ncbi:MAG: EamA family transporter, partial [Pikeienuella sp.]
FAVMAALANALTNTFIAANRNAATPLGYTFYAVNGVAIVVGVYWLLLERQVPALTAQVWIQGSALFSVTGIVFAGLAMLLARGNVGRVSIMLYVQMPVALFLGWLVLGENPTSHSLIGGVIIVVFGASIPLSRNRSSEKAA